MSRELKALGTRWKFTSRHWTVEALNGREVTIVAVYEDHIFDYCVQTDDGKQATTVDRELVAL